jgi:capsular exopolysaccharide synthesis family protein
VFAFLSLRENKYSIKSRILITEIKNSNKLAPSEIPEDYSPAINANSVENTINALSSRNSADSAVKKMSLCFRVYREGDFPSREVYLGYMPLTIETISFYEKQFAPKKFHFVLLDSAWFKLTGEGGSRTFKFGDIINLGFGQFRFYFKGGYTGDNLPLVFQIYSPQETVNLLTRNFCIQPTSKNSGSIDLSIIDNIPDRGIDVLKTYLEVYNSSQKRQRNHLADSAIALIDDRTNQLVGELDTLEQKIQRIQNLKRNSDLAIVAARRRLVQEKSNKKKREASNFNTQLKAMDHLLEFLKNNQTHAIPASLIIDEKALNQMERNYNDLQIRRDELIKTSGAGNQKVAETTVRIDNLRKEIIIALNSTHNSTLSNLNDLPNHTDEVKLHLPGPAIQDPALPGYAREKKVKEELYLYMLKKREAISISRSLPVDELTLIDPPNASILPGNPKASILYLTALSLGLIAPAIYFYLKSISARKAKKAKALLASINVPMIGEIGSLKKNLAKNPMPLKSPVAEQFRRLEFNLNSRPINGSRSQTFLLTSNSRKEGKSFISYNLARLYSTLGYKTILVECDLRRPRLARIMALKGGYGVTDFVMHDNLSIQDVIYKFPSFQNCFYIPAGQANVDPIDTLRSDRISRLFRYLKENFNTIIIDTPPFGSVVDPIILTEYADVNLFVVKESNSEAEYLESLQEFKKHSKVKDVRIIINHAKLYRTYGYG